MTESANVDQPSLGVRPCGGQSVYFLGGRDLEMVEIARVLSEHNICTFDHALDWSHAMFSAYAEDIRSAVSSDRRAVLVELREIPPEVRSLVDVIDHHGPESGHLPTSLEQVFARLGIARLSWEQELIAANDKGYIEGMAAIGASPEEMNRIRLLDRQAQGITAEQEADAVAAVALRDESAGSLTIVALPHEKTATVTDRLSASLGGPGYKNLLVESPFELSFFGEGRLILELVHRFGGYCGGNLPHKGYWGLDVSVGEARSSIKEFVRHAFVGGTIA